MMEQRLLRPKEVEEIYRIDAGTLANWRCQGRGPAYVKCGWKVLYPVDSIEEWCDAHKVKPMEKDKN